MFVLHEKLEGKICYNSKTVSSGASVYFDAKTFLSQPNVPKVISVGAALLVIAEFFHGVSSVRTVKRTDFSRDSSVVATTVIASSKHRGITAALFGDYVPSQLDAAGVKKSQLHLTVEGILFSEHEGASQVIIRTGPERVQMFREGDILPGKIVIKRITKDGVLVGREGSLESLSLPKNELQFEPPANPLIEE